MDEFLSHNVPDAPTPISSAGFPTQSYKNAAGEFDLKNKYGSRKIKSRKDSNPPSTGTEPMRDNTDSQYIEGPLNTGGSEKDDATQRYFGSFSLEAKRNVMDLLKNHPMFDEKANIRLNRIQNNTREVMPHDRTKLVENAGYLVSEDLPQASQTKY